MDKISEDLFQFAFELYVSTVDSLCLNDTNLIISFGSIHIHKYFGKIDFGIEESFSSQAEMILKNAIVHGEQPEYPSRIRDLALVKDGTIFGKYIDYPFTAKGDIQLVITFITHEKVTIRSSKVFMVIKDLDNQKSQIK